MKNYPYLMIEINVKSLNVFHLFIFIEAPASVASGGVI